MPSKLLRINLSEAKAHLGKYAKQAREGKHFLICERNEPIAELKGVQGLEKPKKTIKLGLAKDQIQFIGDWNELDEDIADLFLSG